jgi:hypothetical protein
MSKKQNDNPWVKISTHGTIQSPNDETNWGSLLGKSEGALSPAVANSILVASCTNDATGKIDTVATIAALQEQIASVGRGDMSQVEAMLYAQAASLQSIYVKLFTRAMGQDGLHQFNVFMAMALKAQAQCRCTLEALNEVKFPKTATFVKQANIAQQQQVNNGSLVRAEKKEDPTNELLKEAHHELVAGSTKPAVKSHPAMEAVGPFNGAANLPRQKAKRAKRP